MTHADQPIPERPVVPDSASARPPVEQAGTEQGVTERPVSRPAPDDRRSADAPGASGAAASGRAVPEGSVAEAPATVTPAAGHSLDGPGVAEAPAPGREAHDDGLRERSAHGHTVSEHDAAGAQGAQGARGPEALPGDGVPEETVLRPDERDKLQLRLQHAVGGFVDEPRAAVEEAASAVDDLAEHIIETLGHRRGTLRESWQDTSGTAATEDLRMALREYRRLAERLLSL
ncbi:hypothetical protein [Streptomyces sp. NBC_00083]|uniref:hypothetical protein n=1 Tax=Streptomyces sp. NBC_00083 TaxID=2975647 RepID=UPI002258E593|nr:hypothetical protein [Streptomyces sp. NBC_00083]MCX5384114.1 hypothetical protein [Streptomyces sp. NBC_00083]